MAQQLGTFEKVLRFGEGRRLKRLADQAAYVATLEPDFERLSDADLAAKTVEFRQRVENGEHLDEVLFEAFAAIREAYKRTMDVRLFDVQLMGGIVLHEGDIAEMRTGEGKTFVAVQPLYLNALDLTRTVDGTILAVDGQQIFGSLPALEERGEREGPDYAVHAERLDGDLWEIRAAAL